jgi:hypothetical protein
MTHRALVVQLDGNEDVPALRAPQVQHQLAGLTMHAHATVATTAINIVLSLVTAPEVAQEFSATQLMANLAAQLRLVGDPSSPSYSRPSCAHLRLNILSAMLAILKHGQQHLTTASQCLPQLMHAARQDQPHVQLAACAVVGALLRAENVQTLTGMLCSMPELQLPMPFGCMRQGGASGSGDSSAAQGCNEGQATEMLLRLRSAIVPLLVQLLQVKEVCEAVPTILYPVISNEPDLQRAVTDSNALECLASIIVAEVCCHPPHF